jgi:glutamate--cysteine ligase
MTQIIPLLQELLTQRADAVQAWFAKAYAGHDAPFYSSVDVRHAGHKIAPVDTNLFPAGFNNLSMAGKARAVSQCATYFEQHYPHVQSIALVTESHTRNQPYFANVMMLRALLEATGKQVIFTRFDLEPEARQSYEMAEGSLQAEGMRVKDGKVVCAGGMVADMMLLNNDLSAGCPEMLCEVTTPIVPHPSLGWFARRKTTHFTTYNHVVNMFCTEFGLDGWLLSTLIHRCGKIDFKERIGMECVALAVDKMIFALAQKHREYGIARDPYVYVKADSGTYGMGIMTVRSGAEVMEINKRERNKMNVIKEGVKNNEVIIQEGVPTIDAVEGRAAEPLAYLMAGEVVDIFWRSNAQRDDEISLNAAGMEFTPYDDAAFADAGVVKLIARLASLAAAHEHYDMQEAMREGGEDILPCGKRSAEFG